jgi:single-strand DNA-binding protein
MFNKVVLLGNLTRDIEVKYTPSGAAVASTGVATNRKFKKTDGSQGEEVMFIDITLFGKTAEIAQQYLKKGSKALFEGRLKLDTWSDQSGAKRSKHTVVVEALELLESKETGQKAEQKAPKSYAYQHEADSDEIPF